MLKFPKLAQSERNGKISIEELSTHQQGSYHSEGCSYFQITQT
jgi:hypothetical protein